MSDPGVNTSSGVGKKGTLQKVGKACLRCKTRKVRCNGSIPSCQRCQQQNESCHYAERRQRGPGKSKQHIRMLEERVRSIEKHLQHARDAAALEDIGLNSHLNAEENALEPKVPGEDHNLYAPTPFEDEGSHQSVETSKPCLNQLDSPKEYSLPNFMSDVGGVVQDLHTRQHGGSFSYQIFVPLPPKDHAVGFIELVLDDLRKSWPGFSINPATDLLDYQPIAGLETYHQDPCRWSILNVLLAIGIQLKAANGAVGELFPMSWSYFKNAFSVFPDLFVNGKGLRACQALLLMAMFMQGTGDSQNTFSLVSTATRSLQLAGLHLRETYLNMGPEEAEQHRRVFWMIYIISADVAMKHGLPIPISYDKVAVELPTDNSIDSASKIASPPDTGLLRHMAQLSLIQARVSEQLNFTMSSSQYSEVHSQIAVQIKRQIEEWRIRLPSQIQSTIRTCVPDTESGPASTKLCLTYYAIEQIVESAIMRFQSVSSPKLTQSSSLELNVSSMSTGLSTIANPARATILLQLHVAPVSLPHFWQILSFSTPAFLFLFANLIGDPSHYDAHSSIALLNQHVSHIHRITSEQQYDMPAICHGLSKLSEIAALAVNISRNVIAIETLKAREALLYKQYRHIRTVLEKDIDMMHVASGLIGNAFVPLANAVQIFDNVFEISLRSNNGFGPFVPSVLQPLSYGFVRDPP